MQSSHKSGSGSVATIKTKARKGQLSHLASVYTRAIHSNFEDETVSTDNYFSHSVPSLDTELDAFGQTERGFVPLFLLALRRLSNIMIEDESFPPSRDLSRSGNVGISEVTKAKSRGLGAPIGISGEGREAGGESRRARIGHRRSRA